MGGIPLPGPPRMDPPSRPSLRRSLLLTTLAVVPLAALIILGASGPPGTISTPEGEVRDGVREITIRAHTWGFSPRVVYVEPEETVRFLIESEDIRHGFAINELGVNVQLQPERQARTPAVRADLPEGAYTIHCSIFCGLGHVSMKGHLIVGQPGASPASLLPWVASLVSLLAAAGFAALVRREGR